MDPDLSKADLRQAAAAARARLREAPDADARQARALAHLAGALAGQGARPLAGFLPIRSEIDPRPVMEAHPGPVGVPVIDGPGQPLRFRRWTPQAALVRGRFGAMVPASGPEGGLEDGDEVVPEILIVPLLAWDRRGFRLGYGGGFYDRTLARLRGQGPVWAVGLAFAGQEVARVPTEVTDARLDALVSEDGVIVF